MVRGVFRLTLPKMLNELRAELKSRFAEDRKLLEERKIRVIVSRPDQLVALLVTIGVVGCRRERGSRERGRLDVRRDFVLAALGMRVWISDDVDAIVVLPSRFVSTPDVTVKGVPETSVVTPFTCHPLSTWRPN